MDIRVNGEKKTVPPDSTLHDLLIALDLDPTQPGIAVALDREVIPKTTWREVTLTENVEVEIIRAVQGG